MTPERLEEANKLRNRILELKRVISDYEKQLSQPDRSGGLVFRVFRQNNGFSDGANLTLTQPFSDMMTKMVLLDMKAQLEEIEQEMREL